MLLTSPSLCHKLSNLLGPPPLERDVLYGRPHRVYVSTVHLFQNAVTTPNTACSVRCRHNLCSICVYPVVLYAVSSLSTSVCSSIAEQAIRIMSSAYLRLVIIIPPICKSIQSLMHHNLCQNVE